jgi:hypothetical protein
VSVSNSSSRGDRKLDKPAAVRDPLHAVQIGRNHAWSTDERQRRVAVEGSVAAGFVVVGLVRGRRAGKSHSERFRKVGNNLGTIVPGHTRKDGTGPTSKQDGVNRVDDAALSAKPNPGGASNLFLRHAMIRYLLRRPDGPLEAFGQDAKPFADHADLKGIAWLLI